MKKRKSGKTGQDTAAAVGSGSLFSSNLIDESILTATYGPNQIRPYPSTTTPGPGTAWTSPWVAPNAWTGTTITTGNWNFPRLQEVIAAMLRFNAYEPKETTATLDWHLDVSPDVVGILQEEDHETRKILHGIACGKTSRKLDITVKGLPVEIVRVLEGMDYEYCPECRAIF